MITINRNQIQNYPYHLVDLSPWPVLVSFSLLSLLLGAVMFLHGFNYGGTLLTLGFILTAAGMTLWFRDVVVESVYIGAHTLQVQKGLMIGFILFIISEVMVFFSVFWTFFHSALSPTIELGSSWPPLGFESIDPFGVPLINTILLLSSGAFVTWSHHSLISGIRNDAINGLIVTILLAVIFTGLQGMEYADAPFTITDSVYGSVFYASTGLHGAHVIIGTLFLIVCLIRLINYHYTSTHHLGYESAILYFHMVDVVWLFLFIVVYYWSGG